MKLIRSMTTGIAAIAAVSVSTAAAMAAVTTNYSLNLSQGKFPAGVLAENLNGVIPDVAGYSRGYTKSGWLVDRYSNRGYVALAPTFTGSDDTSCESALTLPVRTIGEDEWLSWEALSVYRHFPDGYRVEAIVDGSDTAVQLFSTEAEKGVWQKHVVSLGSLAGKDVALRFVTTSTSGYMLALTEVQVISGFDSYLQVADLSRRMQGYLDGTPAVRVEITNFGDTQSDLPMQCVFRVTDLPEEEGVAIDFTASGEWKNGETRSFAIEVPEELWGGCASYIVAPAGEASDHVTGGVAEGSVTVGPFSRRMLVDKGTGMWCVNCPAGDVALDALRDTYGDDIIAVNTHVNDALENADYWEQLRWYSVPMMMLDRIRFSAGDGTQKFGEYLDAVTGYGLRLNRVELSADGSIEATATVSVAEATDNSADRYRISYVVTGDFHDPSNPEYIQQNTCNSLKYGAYYMLPSKILPALMRYEDVSLTCGSTFMGMDESLPDDLLPGEGYDCSWKVDVPELAKNPADLRMVALIIDSQTGYVLNADELRVGESPDSGTDVPTVMQSLPALRADGDGNLWISGPEGEKCTVEIFTLGGERLWSRRHECSGGAERLSHTLSRGLYVARLTAGNVCTGLKLHVR